MIEKNQNTKTQSQRGNALFFILIAVVLLGLLTMVLSRGGSKVEQSGSFEQARIQVGQILRYTRAIESAIQEMKLRNVSENDISFENTTTTVDYTNANCDDATDRSFPGCLLFDVEGAGLEYRNFANANDGSDWTFTSLYNVGSTSGPIGSTSDVTGNDIIMVLSNIDESLCTQINRELDVGVTGTTPTDNDFTTPSDPFVGTFPTGLTILEGATTSEPLNGQSSGCFADGNADLHFYHVVLAR